MSPNIADESTASYGKAQHLESLRFGARLSIEVYELANGLRVLLVPDASAPVVSYHTWFRVGSRNERPGKTGIAHLFEHLMFNETENLPKGEFDRRLEEAGAETNASTWLDFTQYNIAAPSERLPLVVQLEADRMQHLVLREPQVESEKEVVANERRYRVDDDVEGAVSEVLWSMAFEKHPYHWPTIGWMDDILAFTTEDCAEFYHKYYSPNNASVIVVGDFDIKHALQLISAHYGNMPPASLPVEQIAAEPMQTAERRTELSKPTQTEKLSIGYRAVELDHPDHLIASVLVELLSGGRASRLHRRLVRELELASEVRMFLGPFRDPGLLEVYATARTGHTAEEILSVLEEEFTRIRQEPASPAEIERAEARFELGLLHGLETADGKAQTIGFYDCLLKRPNAAFERLAQLSRVTSADIQRVAGYMLDPSRRNLVIVRPNGASEEEQP